MKNEYEIERINNTNITIGDCLDNYNFKNLVTIINDGKVVGFEKE
jgi:hypothetical protein